MTYIKVDHSKLKSTSEEIKDYVSLMKKEMKSAQAEVTTLGASWQGADFAQLKTEFDKVDNADSTHTKMLKSLDSYADYLQYAANKYKDAQARAVNRANNLPRW